MASECSVADQSITELTRVKKLGDDTKEEEKHEPEDVSVADEINKEEEHKQVSSSSESALETNEGKLVIFTSKEPVNSAFKQEDLKAVEVAQTSENEIKPESSNDKAEIELVESEDSKDDVHELVHTEVPIVVFPDASEVPEEIDVDRSTLTSISVPVKNLEVESGSPEEHKSEESAETKPNLELIKSEDTKGEVQELVPAEISAVDSEAPEENNADSITPTAIEVPLKDPESSVFLEEKKPEEHGENKEHVELSRSVDSKEVVHELVPTEVSINAEASEKNDVDSSARAIVEVPVKDFEVVSSSPEEQNAEVGAESEVKELIKSGYSKEEGQELVSEEVPTDISEAIKKNDVNLSVPTSAEVPLKDLEVESGSPEEQKLEEGVETKVDIELIESGESKDEGQDLVSGEVPTNTSEAPEKNDVDLSAPTSTVVPVKNLEVESSSPGEQKPEEGAETKVNIKLIESGDSKVEGQESVSAEVPASISEEHEGKNTDLSTPTGIEVPVKDLEVESGSPKEQKIEESAETKVSTDFIKSGESKDEGQASGEVPTSSSQAPEINDVDSSIPTSREVPVKDLEVESVSPEEQKPEEGAETKVNIKLIESGDSKVEGQESVSSEVPASTSEENEGNNTDQSTPTGIEVPVKDLEVESGSPEEQKIEESAETKVSTDFIKSGESKDEGQASGEVPTSSSQAPEIIDVDLSIPTSTEVPVKDLEVESGSPEEQKPEEGAETEVNIKLIESGDSKVEGQESVSGEVPASTSEEREDNNTDLSTPNGIEVPVKDLEVESGSPEEQKPKEGAETKVNIKLIESGDSKVERLESVSAEAPASTYEEHEANNTDLSTPTGIEVPVKDLEVESGSPEEQKIEESAETKVSTDFIKSGKSKDEGQASGEGPSSSSQAPEINDVDLSIPTSTEVPVKDLEVESGSPEEQKPEEGAETKVNIKLIESGDSKVERLESVSAEAPASTSEEHEGNNTDLSTPTGIEVPVKDLEVESGSPEEQKIEESAETKANTDFIKSRESKDEGQASGEVPTSSSQAPEINDVDLSIPTSIEVPVKDLEVESGSPEEQRSEEGAETKVNIKLIELGDSKVEGQESVSAEVPASTSEEREENNADLSTPTGIEVPVNDLKVESGYPEEKKFEGSAEIKVNTDFVKSGESKDEGQDLVSGDVPTNTSETPEISAVDLSAVDLSAPTSTEVPVKDLEVESGSPEEQKAEVNIELMESGDSKVEGQEFVSAEVPDNTSNAREKEDVELSTPTSMKVPLKDLEVKSGSPEEQKLEESAKTNVDIESLKLGDSKDEGQESVFAEVSTNASEEHEHNNVDLTSSTSMEVPVKDLEVEFGSAEEQNPKESVETKEPSSDVITIDGGGEVTGSSSYEDKSSGVGEVVDKEDEGLKEEVIQTRIEEVQTPSDEDKVSEAVAVKKDDEIVEDGIEGSTVLDVVPSVPEVFPDEVVEESKDETSEVDNTDTAPKVSEVSLEGGNVLEEDVNVEAIERDLAETSIDLAETSIDSTAGGVSTGQAKIPENVEVEPLELKFEELDVSPETGEVPSVGGRVSAVDEKSETSKGEERKDETSEVDNTDTAPNVSEVSSAVGNVLEKDVNVEAIERDLAETSIDSTVGSVSTTQAKNCENVEVEPFELKFEELNVSPEASEVPSVGERVSAGDEKSESSKGGEMKDEISEADNTDSTPNVSEVSSAVANVLEKDVNVEAIERDLAEATIDPTVDGVSTEQAKIPENVEVKPLELKFEELKPEASQVPSAGERFSAGDEKSENSKGETGAILVETPKDIATSDESLAHLVEETENEDSKSETEASVEQFPEAVKEIIASESYNAKKDETSRDVSLEEKNANVNQDKKSEVKVEGVIENAPEHEELGIEKREGEKPKDEKPIPSSDTRDVKLIKEATKRDSNIFAKVKRSIIKAKKAILGKSPGPKTVSSESKDENI